MPAIVAALAVCLAAATAWAHGGLSMEQDTCKLRAGVFVMHFTGYQPDSTAEREFCEDIPATGRTVIVLDYLDEKLRSLPVEVRIVRDVGDESHLDAITVFHKPPAVYPKGSLFLEHTFPERGRFVGLVTVSGEPLQVSRFPFSVGRGAMRAWLLYGLFGAGALGLGVALFLYSSREGHAPVVRTRDSHTRRAIRFAALATLLVLTGLPAAALAHARLVRSDPPQRATLDEPPRAVRLWFNEPLEPAFARLVVTNEKGDPVTESAARVAPEDAKLLVLELPALSPGAYAVSYEVLSVDGHRVKQSFPFAVTPRPAAR